jgi:hypothetical protein
MRFGLPALRKKAACFTFAPTSSIITPASSKVALPSFTIAAARNTFTPTSSNVVVASFTFTTPSSKNREAGIKFLSS